MGLLKFTISLDQPVHYPGQTISGRLLVQVDKPMSMRAINLRYTGKGTVRWTETKQRHRGTRLHNGRTKRTTETYTVTYSNSEHYLELEQLVFGNYEENCELHEGEHAFVFNFQLPMNLPSSFEGLYGRIRYSVTATINRPWKFNHVTTQPITVMSVFDLNHNPLAVAPVAEQTSKTFWGQSKQLFMTVNLPVRGFVPGQIIPVRVFLNNESGVQVETLYVTLKQNVTFHATNKSRAVKMYVFKNEFPVPKGTGCEEVPLNLQLPAVPPSRLDFSRIIDLNYQLNVTAKVKPWYHKNLKIRTEVIVGNVPLMGYQRPIQVQQLDQGSSSSSQDPDSRPPSYGFVFPPEMMSQDFPPPTYEQSMGLEIHGSENPEKDPDSDGELTEFAPLYPVYKF